MIPAARSLAEQGQPRLPGQGRTGCPHGRMSWLTRLISIGMPNLTPSSSDARAEVDGGQRAGSRARSGLRSTSRRSSGARMAETQDDRRSPMRTDRKVREDLDPVGIDNTCIPAGDRVDDLRMLGSRHGRASDVGSSIRNGDDPGQAIGSCGAHVDRLPVAQCGHRHAARHPPTSGQRFEARNVGAKPGKASR
jgi:hypothetical protein